MERDIFYKQLYWQSVLNVGLYSHIFQYVENITQSFNGHKHVFALGTQVTIKM